MEFEEKSDKEEIRVVAVGKSLEVNLAMWGEEMMMVVMMMMMMMEIAEFLLCVWLCVLLPAAEAAAGLI